MAKTIKVRAKQSGDITKVKALISHPMETGFRKNKKTGKKIPAHFIQEVTCKYKGKTVFTANWGPAVSKNPYLAFELKNVAKGDTLTLSWVDNKGESASIDASVR